MEAFVRRVKSFLAQLQQYNLSSSERKVVGLAALGGMLEFYDFIIYGMFSIYFADQFFPNGNAFISIIQSYIVFVLGYLARPIGGIIFSYIGDEDGRKKVLIMTITLMGLSSLGIGILPPYKEIGMAAPIILLLLRLIQGLALGGELPSTYVYINESMPNKLGTGFGCTMVGVNGGLLLGIIINQFINAYYSHQEIINYAWRFPFILGGILCLISYKIRYSLHETQAFKQIVDKPKIPIFYLLKFHLFQVLMGIFITAIMSSMSVVVIVFMPTYLAKIIKINQDLIPFLMFLTSIANLIIIFLTGILANIIHPKKIFLILIIIAIPLVFACYYLLANQILLGISLITLGIIEGVAAALTPLILTTLFPTKVGLTGVAVCYNIGFTMFAGFAPVIITSLVNSGFNVFIVPVVYLWVMLILSLLGLLLIHKKLSEF
ncbi:MAG TPA: MFS transporter [Burkholderiales bacterium]|nr:MFS transporter [Burkholderiales bacterium]